MSWAALLLAAALPARALPSAKEMRARGFEASARVGDTIDGVPFTAVLYRAVDGGRGGLVEIYARHGKRDALVYTHPSGGGEPHLEQSQPRKHFSSLLKDGVKTLVYRMTDELTGKSTLYVARYRDGRFRRFASFPEGTLRDFDGDGVPEIIVRKPIEGPTVVRCEEFRADVGFARQTEILGWDGKAFVSVSSKYPDFYEKRLEADRRAVDAFDLPKKLSAMGSYGSAVITLYFDEKAAGHPREAWRHLNARVEEDSSNLAVRAWNHSKECVPKLRAEARKRLNIPDDWE